VSTQPGTETATNDQRLLGLIGNTPLVKVERLDTGPCELFLKLENHNPGGSIKDRIGLAMIEAAERAGKLSRGATVVEATAGNTGLGLALVAARKGYRLVLVIPDKMSQEKVFHLRALGAEVRMTRSDVAKGHPEYYQDMAERIAREEGGYYINQFANPANPLAHETTTAPEIWRQTGQRLDAVVAGVGSGGTITGLSRYFAKVAPAVDIVLADPAGSVLAEYVKSGHMGQAGSWLVEGIGEDFLPSIADLSRVKHAFTIPDEESLMTARALLREEGILGGSSSGTLVAAALRYCKAQTQPKRVVTFVCDSGNKYLSKMYNDYWMRDQGFLRGVPAGDLRDVIGRSDENGSVVAVAPTDTLLVAHGRMKLYDISQLPVLDQGGPAKQNGSGSGHHIVGLLDESDLLLATLRDPAAFRKPVRDFMTKRLTTVTPSTAIEALWPIFDAGMVAIVVDGERFLGLITRIDVLNYLRRKLP
jgi:cystathionine beta-synthase